eukprot:1015907-Rhodomonas_salina.1
MQESTFHFAVYPTLLFTRHLSHDPAALSLLRSPLPRYTLCPLPCYAFAIACPLPCYASAIVCPVPCYACAMPCPVPCYAVRELCGPEINKTEGCGGLTWAVARAGGVQHTRGGRPGGGGGGVE